VIAEPRTNQLFVSDIQSRLEVVQDLIRRLDIALRQVVIEARIVEADDSFGRSLGVRLGGGDTRGVRGGDAGYTLGGNNRIAFAGSYDAINATSGQLGGGLSNSNTTFVNLPAGAVLGTQPATIALSLFNSAANRFLSLELSAMEADGRGKVVASPRVITADQTKAFIEQGTQIPYPVASSSGATAIEFRPAVLRLDVTPQITPEGNVILDVDVNKDAPGLSTPSGPSIDTKKIKTQVVVENGGTVVIGGVFEISENTQESRVPLLGDVPFMGHLFRNKFKQVQKRELLVFLTPRVLTEKALAR
jgi:type IV pilus assembly protein PilQ